MPIEQLMFFSAWLVLAVLAAALLYYAWERLRSKSFGDGATAGRSDP